LDSKTLATFRKPHKRLSYRSKTDPKTYLNEADLADDLIQCQNTDIFVIDSSTKADEESPTKQEQLNS
jgi:hypothetical protein